MTTFQHSTDPTPDGYSMMVYDYPSPYAPSGLGIGTSIQVRDGSVMLPADLDTARMFREAADEIERLLAERKAAA